MNGSTAEGGRVTATRRMRWVVLGAACALIIDVFAWCANPGDLELGGSGAQDSYYNLLVQGFRTGQLNVKREAPVGLAQLADPYDPSANFAYRYVPGSLLDDMSYYRGRLYLYFGVTPILVLFWPYAALTGHYLFHKDAVVIFYAVGFLASVGLLWAVWRRYFAEVSFGVVVAGALVLGLATGTPVILQRSDIYETAISCGYALVVLALAAIWCALHEPSRRGRWLTVASLAYGLAVAARPSLLFGAVILLVPVIQSWCERRPIRTQLMAAISPIALIGLGLMLYNKLRFDNPLEFGMRYQLSCYRQTAMEFFGLRYLAFNVRLYFLEPARWSTQFPFVHDVAAPALPAGYGGVEHPFGALSNIPMVWLALALPLTWRGRSAEARWTLRWFLAVAVASFAINVLTLVVFSGASIRYEGEFLPASVLLAVFGILGLERALAGRPFWRRTARFGWGLLLACSVAFNLFASAACHADAYANLGQAFFIRGQVDEAIADYQNALKLMPDSARIHNNLGTAFLQKGQIDPAIAHFQKALEIQPDSSATYNNLGTAFLRKGLVDEAITSLEKALELQPGYADACNNLGSALRRRGRVDEAIAQYQTALKIRPDFFEAHYNLGNVLLQEGQAKEATIQFKQVLEIQPGDAMTHNILGDALLRQGQAREAIAHYEKALEIQPDYAVASKNLAWVLATSAQASVRDGSRAIELARRANQLSGDSNPAVLQTLAAAYAEAGQFTEAVPAAERALQLASTRTNTALVVALRVQLGLYQAGSPFRDTKPVADLAH